MPASEAEGAEAGATPSASPAASATPDGDGGGDGAEISAGGENGEAHGGGHGAGLGKQLPLWSVVPFILMLLAIAVLPLVREHWWEKNRNRAIVAVALSLPVALYLLLGHGRAGGLALAHQMVLDYIPFIVLLGALFVISGGIVLRGSLAGTPEVNVIFLAVGALIASFIGTTGASMILIRPLLRANRERRRKIHVVVFFIFLVSNIGGLLTPLGDPPLFLGFLKGVPFIWTFGLWKQWLAVNVVLLALFYVIDNVVFRREDIARKKVDLDEEVQPHVPLQLVGRHNFILLAGVVVVIYCSGTFQENLARFLAHWDLAAHTDYIAKGLQVLGMLLMAGLSLKLTKRRIHEENSFGWGPIIEVAILFAGIFVTMIPALQILNYYGMAGRLPVSEPWHFFWATGVLSSFLDNAPTYLTFAATAAGMENVPLDGQYLAKFLETGGADAGALLAAISGGAVFMGANTYIGNAPNFMVKSIAEENGIKMPSFFGYMLYSTVILLPIFVVVPYIFF